MDSSIYIEALLVSVGHDFKGRFGKGRLRNETHMVSSIRCVAGKGIEGDRFFGHRENFKGQITFMDRTTIEAVESAIGKAGLDPVLFRRNVLTQGADLNRLIGRVFSFGDTVFEGTEECAPCFWMDETVGDGAMAAMKGIGGLRCRIVESGTLTLGRHELNVLA